ncbi:MAG: DUF5060 domain-containing protein, partial [Phycisphaeraceae bacterium]|nr:DUF5060 domain-containing protein [Phycisphaeraceae bacterium]
MRFFCIGLLLLTWCDIARAAAVVSGELKQYHPITLTVEGPEASETGEVNPFRDYRLKVFFFQIGSEDRITVPGYFAADGNAAETGATKGNKWRVHFTPPKPGRWMYGVSFRAGKDIALNPDPKAGRTLSPDAEAGRFDVAPTDKKTPDFRGRGFLRYVGKRYLRFDSGGWFLKGGADSPENFLAYAEFDGTQKSSGKKHKGKSKGKPLHHYKPHVRDWRKGDPTWRGGRGKGIVGAVNYLADQKMNSIYFLTMNVRGDGKDVWPWTDEKVRDRFDCSKLDQWEILFRHMTRRGVMMHVITQETENDQLLDRGDLGPHRKLYYRELIARFAHHPALVWNLGEENTNTDAQRRAFCRYIRDLDPNDHPIVCHTYPGQYDKVYKPLLGFEAFEGPSLQTNNTHRQTITWIDRSRKAGRPWVVCLDEIGPAHTGVKPDKDDPTHDQVRTRHLWGNLMAGGAGVEWYFGYKYAHNDLNCEDWRSRQAMWDQTRYALAFFQRLPLDRMTHADDLIDAKGA